MLTQPVELKEKINKAKELTEKIYGEIPQRPVHLSGGIKSSDTFFAAGKAIMNKYELLIDLGEREVALPFIGVIPNRREKLPAIIFLSNEEYLPNKYLPVEEITDRGYAVFYLCTKVISDTDEDFKSGICGKIARSRRRKSSPGKIAVWAWALMRVTEYIADFDFVNKEQIIVAGHGIYARAAMLAAGFDEKTSYVIANGIRSYPIPFSSEIPQSSITVRDFPHLYCPGFVENPFGDEYSALLSLVAPRNLLIGSAEDGEYTDNDLETKHLSALSEEYYLPYGFVGLDKYKNTPTASIKSKDGEISYHLRCGTDYFSREDWKIYLDFIDEKIAKNN